MASCGCLLSPSSGDAGGTGDAGNADTYDLCDARDVVMLVQVSIMQGMLASSVLVELSLVMQVMLAVQVSSGGELSLVMLVMLVMLVVLVILRLCAPALFWGGLCRSWGELPSQANPHVHRGPQFQLYNFSHRSEKTLQFVLWCSKAKPAQSNPTGSQLILRRRKLPPGACGAAAAQSWSL